MARTTIKIKFLGTPNFQLFAMLNYPRQFVSYNFTYTGETYDVTDICSADDLNRNATITDLRNASRVGGQLIEVDVTPGNSDVDGAGFGNGPDPSATTPGSTVANGSPVVGIGTTYARADHVHDIATGAVGTTELAASGVTLAKIASAAQASLACVLNFGQGAANAATTTFLAPGSGAGSTTVEYQIPVPHAGTIRNMYIKAQTAPGSGKTDVFTVRKNGVNTTLTASVVTTATTANDTTHSFTVAAGDLVSVQNVAPSGSAGANYQACLEYGLA